MAINMAISSKYLGLVLIVLACASAYFILAWQPKSYSFFVAGHAFGNPRPNAIGLYSHLLKKAEYLSANDTIQFGVFTVDIVFESNKQSWDAVDTHVEAPSRSSAIWKM